MRGILVQQFVAKNVAKDHIFGGYSSAVGLARVGQPATVGVAGQVGGELVGEFAGGLCQVDGMALDEPSIAKAVGKLTRREVCACCGHHWVILLARCPPAACITGRVRPTAP